MRRITWSAVALLALSCGGDPESPLEPAPEPTPQLIAFHSTRATNTLDIFTIDLAGTVTPVVVEATAEDQDPDLSPNRTRIVFASNRGGKWGIYVVNADGTNLTPVVADAMDNSAPSWAPDGQRIVFARGGVGLHVVNANGTGLTPLTTTAADATPAWSPDGTRIAYERAGDIWIVDADGSDPAALTATPGGEGQPAWMPDGSRVLYHFGGDVHSVATDGSNPGTLTTNLAGNAAAPAVSPDGQWLIYVGLRTPNAQILKRRVAEAGGGETLVTMAGAYNGHPSWR